jgi:hypothetical protein
MLLAMSNDSRAAKQRDEPASLLRLMIRSTMPDR